MIEHNTVRFDATPCGIGLAQTLIFNFKDAVLQNTTVDCLEHSVVFLVALGGHTQDVQDLAIFLVVRPNRARQTLLDLAPEALDAIPERSAGERMR